jgi:hypothetical protein
MSAENATSCQARCQAASAGETVWVADLGRRTDLGTLDGIERKAS